MSKSFRIPMIGITGGIGSGKSSVTREAAKQRNWFVIDADRIGHEVLKLDEIKSALADVFGQDILDPNGAVNRSALAEKVFGPQQTQQRKQLEAIVHPEIRRQCQQSIEQAAHSGQFSAAILDAAILLEAGWNEICDSIVFIETDFSDRLRRVQTSRGWTEHELKQRELSQLSLSEKRAKADFVIDNRGNLSDAARQLIEHVDRLIRIRNQQTTPD